MIVPFFGELFKYPIPLELSHNYCSNKCSYCFANLNKPDRKAETGRVANQIKNFHQKEDAASVLLQNRMGICISNKTDPFAVSNYKVAIPEIKTFLGMDVPIAFHTRMGKPFDDFYKSTKIPPSTFYISICQSAESIRKRVEPGATSLDYRWEMAKQLRSDGHSVIVALNPYVHNWIDKEEYIDKLLDADIEYCIVQPLHLNPEQIAAMSPKEVAAIGEFNIGEARKRGKMDAMDEVGEMVDEMNSIGINAFDTQRFNDSDIMDGWHDGLRGKSFKTYQDFYKWCRVNKKDNDIITFDEFYDYMRPECFKEDVEYAIYQYLTSVDRSYRKTRQSGKFIPQKLTFKHLVRLMWNDVDCTMNITRNPKFSILGGIKNGTEYRNIDDEGNQLIVFSSKDFTYRLFDENEI